MVQRTLALRRCRNPKQRSFCCSIVPCALTLAASSSSGCWLSAEDSEAVPRPTHAALFWATQNVGSCGLVTASVLGRRVGFFGALLPRNTRCAWPPGSRISRPGRLQMHYIHSTRVSGTWKASMLSMPGVFQLQIILGELLLSQRPKSEAQRPFPSGISARPQRTKSLRVRICPTVRCALRLQWQGACAWECADAKGELGAQLMGGLASLCALSLLTLLSLLSSPL